MMFVTYNTETGELVGVTPQLPAQVDGLFTRTVDETAVNLSTWNTTRREFLAEYEQTKNSRITRLAFRNRFTQAEKAAMELASLDDPTASMTWRGKAAALRAHMADVAASTFIDLQRADTRAGVLQLEGLGLLAAGRAVQILDTAPTESELHTGA